MQKGDNPYSRFELEELFLRDELAIDRTLLANERTFLAYLRSSIALIIAGVSFIHFARSSWLEILGLVCVPVGVIILIIATFRYQRVKSNITSVRKRLGTRDLESS
ncbi:MAG: DUF202 domain-containing protein [Candidatus Dadabacteria bacterium]|nr:DUF202 domain-containing protein [Candidatus Dadabacteria bacterium]NIQ16782.1 DUF202 domain-containing protein [Candidatus Dadabacteria bacterium]